MIEAVVAEAAIRLLRHDDRWCRKTNRRTVKASQRPDKWWSHMQTEPDLSCLTFIWDTSNFQLWGDLNKPLLENNVSPSCQIEQSLSYCQAVITACGKEGIFYSLHMNMRQRINIVPNKRDPQFLVWVSQMRFETVNVANKRVSLADSTQLKHLPHSFYSHINNINGSFITFSASFQQWFAV